MRRRRIIPHTSRRSRALIVVAYGLATLDPSSLATSTHVRVVAIGLGRIPALSTAQKADGTFVVFPRSCRGCLFSPLLLFVFPGTFGRHHTVLVYKGGLSTPTALVFVEVGNSCVSLCRPTGDFVLEGTGAGRGLFSQWQASPKHTSLGAWR